VQTQKRLGAGGSTHNAFLKCTETEMKWHTHSRMAPVMWPITFRRAECQVLTRRCNSALRLRATIFKYLFTFHRNDSWCCVCRSFPLCRLFPPLPPCRPFRLPFLFSPVCECVFRSLTALCVCAHLLMYSIFHFSGSCV